jgi:hypothetical protein
MNNDAVAKIKMLQDSMQCFVFGLIGLLPVIGLPFALAALWIAGRVRVREKQYWNPARPYCMWGGCCAALGTIFWFLLAILIAYNAIDGGGGGGMGGYGDGGGGGD